MSTLLKRVSHGLREFFALAKAYVFINLMLREVKCVETQLAFFTKLNPLFTTPSLLHTSAYVVKCIHMTNDVPKKVNNRKIEISLHKFQRIRQNCFMGEENSGCFAINKEATI